MRIVFIPDVGEYYGATEALLQLVTMLVEQHDVEPVLLTSKNGRIAQFAREHGYETYTIGHPAFLDTAGSTPVRRIAKFMLRPLRYVRYRMRLRTSLKKAEQYVDFRNVDLIHTNVNRNDVGALLAKKHHIPHVWHIREFGDIHEKLVSYRTAHIFFMNTHTDAYLTISKAVGNHWMEKGIQREKIHLVYDGVDENRFLLQNTEKKSAESIMKIAFCGSVNQAKGQWQLIEAIAAMEPDEQRQLRVDIYGSGPKEYLVQLQRKIREYGLQDIIHMQGYCDCLEKKLPDYDVGMMCSRSEGFGLVTVEYMMSGLCVIASDTGANPELVPDGECGLLYRYGDIENLASKLRFALNNRTELRKMGMKARKHACENFTAEKNAAQIYAIYQELIAGRIGDTGK